MNTGLPVAAVLVLLVSCSEHVIPYDQYLPSDASEIQLEKLTMGFDYAYYIKAKVGIDGFNEFKERMRLQPSADLIFPDRPVEVSDWWNPKETGVSFSREVAYEGSPTNISDEFWATYEDGYLYFYHLNY